MFVCLFSDEKEEEEEEEEKKKRNDIRGGPRFGIRGDGIDGSTAHPRRRSVDARASEAETILQRWIRRADEPTGSGVDFRDTGIRGEE